MLLRNGMQNHRAAFRFASAEPRQLTLYSVAQDAKSHEELQPDCLAQKQRLLSLQKPREHSTVARPFPSQRVGGLGMNLWSACEQNNCDVYLFIQAHMQPLSRG